MPAVRGKESVANAFFIIARKAKFRVAFSLQKVKKLLTDRLKVLLPGKKTNKALKTCYTVRNRLLFEAFLIL